MLEAIGRVRRFDVYWNRAGCEQSRSHASAMAQERMRRWAKRSVGSGATIVPAFQTDRVRVALRLARQCRTGRIAADESRKLLMNSDTYIAESIGHRVWLNK